MNRDHGPKDCCTYACNQGRDCPVRCKLNTHEGGASIDTSTDLDAVYTWVDSLIVGVRFVLLALSAGCVVMLGFYFFG